MTSGNSVLGKNLWLKLFAFYAIILMSCAFTGAAHAQGLPDTACDPEYMDSLEARAWLEAQREISQNENLISKPDSVLQYSCFGDWAYRLSQGGGMPLFSEAGCCGAPPQATALDSALGSVVINRVNTYLQAHYNHNALGGRSNIAPTNTNWPSMGSHTCFSMSGVWQYAKCAVLDVPAGYAADDGFYDFPWYQNNDPRRWPQACNGGQPAGTIGTRLPIAFNGNQGVYTLASENPGDAAPYLEDPVQAHLDMILPNGVTAGGVTGQCTGNGKPVYTGVTVERNGMAQYDDAVCPNPGCYYTGTGGSCAAIP